MATRSRTEIRRLKVIAMVWGIAVFYGAGMVGLVARVMQPELADGEQALMVMALDLVHPVLAGLLLAAVISAILSTVSSQLLVAASAVSYDIVEAVLGRDTDDRRSLRLGRWTVVVIGILGILVALSEVRLVFWFVLFAWSGLGAAFAPLMLFAAFDRAISRYGALAGMLTGVGVTVAWKLGRTAADNPEAFSRIPWAVIVISAAILLIGRVSESFSVGHSAAVLGSAALTLCSWWLVQHWGLHHLYELVPAFALATFAVLSVSFLFPQPNGQTDTPNPEP
jgi:Na+/proline symporter